MAPWRRVNQAGAQDVRIIATANVLSIEGGGLRLDHRRYERLGPAQLRFVDLGLFQGFTAELEVDEQGLVKKDEGLFERV